MKAIVTMRLGAVVLSSVVHSALAQVAFFDGATGIVSIPSVSVAGTTYVDVTLKNVGGLTFALQSATLQDPQAGPAIASYDVATAVLRIPTVVVGCSTFVDVALADVGNFTFTVTAATEKLEATAAPLSIVRQPANVNVGSGQSASFSVVAGGTAPFSYQWQRNGLDISGATGASYTTPPLSFDDNGALVSVRVSNGSGSLASAAATVAVMTGALGPSIVADPVSFTSVNAGDTPVLSVQSSGFAPRFQWRRNGVDIAGATSASYTLPPVTGADSGAWYSAMVCNASGCVTSLNAQIQVVDGNTSPVAQMVAANNHSLALRADGSVWGWGQSLGGTVSLARPATAVTNQGFPARAMCAPTLPFTEAVQVAGGYSHSLALRRDGTVWATGSGGYGELGNGSNQPATAFAPVMVAPGLPIQNVRFIAAGTGTSHAITADSSAWAWGNNAYGELGDGTSTNRAYPVRVRDAGGAPLTGVTSVKAGTIHALWLRTDGTVWAAGTGIAVGDGTSATHVSPIQVMMSPGVPLTGATAIAAGSSHSVALLGDGTALAWGDNQYGQLGAGNVSNNNRPLPVRDAAGAVLTGIVAIDAGEKSSYFVRADGSVLAAGRNDGGLLGVGPVFSTNAALPVLDAAGHAFGNVRAISAQFRHALAVGSDQTVWGWGNNASMNLADGTRIDRMSPVRVQGLAP